MAQYIIYFNQNWVGEHTAEWFQSRGPLARAVVAEIEQAGALVATGGVDEDVDAVTRFDENGGESQVSLRGGDYIGGLAIIDVKTDEEANEWAKKIAIACGWPQVVRKVV